jgi:hypothetical protein
MPYYLTVLLSVSLLLLTACGTTTTSAPAPTPPPASTAPADLSDTPFLWEITQIVDKHTGERVVADVYLNGALIAQQVTSTTVAIPRDQQRHMVAIAAPGYQEWALGFRVTEAFTEARKLRGPAELLPLPARP